MLQRKGNLWTLQADARCVTTNGIVRKDGLAVMGKGSAEEARHRFPGVDAYLGTLLTDYGNHVFPIQEVQDTRLGYDWTLLSFPTKEHWREKSDLELIRRSCGELMDEADRTPAWQTILLPRPGCGQGGLDWPDVRRIITPLLDDRVVVVSK